MEGPTDLRSTSLSYIFDALFGDTSLDHIFFTYALMPIAHMGIFGKMVQIIMEIKNPGGTSYGEQLQPNGVGLISLWKGGGSAREPVAGRIIGSMLQVALLCLLYLSVDK